MSCYSWLCIFLKFNWKLPFKYLYHIQVKIILIHPLHSNEKQRWYSFHLDELGPPHTVAISPWQSSPPREQKGSHSSVLACPLMHYFLLGFLSPETILPLLAPPADSITEQFLGRGISVSWCWLIYAYMTICSPPPPPHMLRDTE